MHVVLTPKAAQELGRALRLIRNTRQIGLRDLAKAANLSPQYINNIERGDRPTISRDAFDRLARALGGPPQLYEDLLLRARMESAMADRELDERDRTFIWRGVESRLAERGVKLIVLGEALVDLME